MKTIEVRPGDSIGDVAALMTAIATLEGQLIAARFNGIILTAEPFESLANIFARYDQEVKKKQEEYRAKKREEDS